MFINDRLSHRILKMTLLVVFVISALTVVYFLSYKSSQGDVPVIADATSTVPAVTEKVAETKVPAVAKVPTKLWSSWKKTMTTVFWVGEAADADNAYITNTASYWDEKWQEHYGGVDSPNCRIGSVPCEFTPKENPFYFALPYAEYDEQGNLKDSAKTIPWYGKDSQQLLKNRWIAVKSRGEVCYAQWEDVGPNNEDDFAYVFGSSVPTNTFGEKAGLDASPALWNCLHLSDNSETEWAFVDAATVPDGPWKDIVTKSGTSWGN